MAIITRMLNGEPYSDPEWDIEPEEEMSDSSAMFVIRNDYAAAQECMQNGYYWIDIATPLEMRYQETNDGATLAIRLRGGNVYEVKVKF